MTTELLDDAKAAKFLGVSRGSLANWRCSRMEGPPFVKCGRLVRYRVSDIETWLASRTITPVDTTRKAG